MIQFDYYYYLGYNQTFSVYNFPTTGSLVSLMLPESHASLRVAMARAIHRTTDPHTLMRLASVTELLSLLDTWLLQADADRQHTLLHTALRALTVLPFTKHQLRGHAVLKTVRKLHKHRHAVVAACATRLGQQWAVADAALIVQRVAVLRKVCEEILCLFLLHSVVL